MATILFIERQLRNEKLGIMCLSAVLKAAGHQTELIQAEVEDIHAAMQRLSPDFVAFSLMTGEHRYVLQLNVELKRHYRFQTILGGPHCSFFPEIADEEGVDFVVQGAGELVINEIVEGRLNPGLYRGDLVEDFDALPFADRELLYKYKNFRDNPIKNIMTIRDCPYNCSYCYNHLWKQLYHDQRQRLFKRRCVGHVIAEIDAIRARYPLEKINFLDDNFLQQRQWLHEFCRRYRSEVGLPFLINVRANLVEEEMIRELCEAGLQMVNFALESADPLVQRDVLNRGDFSNDSVAASLEIFRKYNIRMRMQNMIGLPVDDPLADALNTLRFNLKHRVDDAWVSIFQPYPRTSLARYCLERGLISDNNLDHCAESFFDESRMDIPDKEKISRLQKWWYFIVRYNLPLAMVKILLEVPMGKDIEQQLLELRFVMSKQQFYGIQERSAEIIEAACEARGEIQ